MILRESKNESRFLPKELKFAIRKEIRQKCRQEAIRILELAEETDRQEFLKHHKEGNGNLCCLQLDFIKKKLIEKRQWEYNPNDCFKDPLSALDNNLK